LNAVLPASGKNGDDTGWVRFKLPIETDPGQIQVAVDRLPAFSLVAGAMIIDVAAFLEFADQGTAAMAAV
jgi:hypothetical protein